MAHVDGTGLLEVEDEAEQATRALRARLAALAENLALFPLLGTYRRMCGLVGADVVEIFVHRQKHEQREQNRGVHRCTCTHSICNILIIG